MGGEECVSTREECVDVEGAYWYEERGVCWCVLVLM